ncbi:hypothetical protein K469DRAFT_340270 [Zopfia rhizophila CBS 207.26]|uniref:G domain-containing protein n=1 Tax=Zopfia rhizophila CBS 207.26 TaxID=1314779 RepID=A0A6A6ENI3_9PEZI|nr:hypothetical protein K469DRAFT_340270 [Zopfia rhizophila CBS 207.26]
MAQSYEKPQQPEDVYFAVMGVTGSGKSTFVSQVSKLSVRIGHGLQSCTSRVEDFDFLYSPSLRIHMIDTPGFDDTNKSDADILTDIADWLGRSYKQGVHLSGILFLHPINNRRMLGSARRNFQMFQKLCGKECFQSLVLSTTHWDTVAPEQAREWEKELQTTDIFFAKMLENGSQYMRHDSGEESARTILEHMIRTRKTFTASIQKEMVDQGLGLQDTGAGQQLNDELLRAEMNHRQEIEELRQDFEEARLKQDERAMQKAQEEHEELQKLIEAERKERAKLDASLEKIKREKEIELQKHRTEIAKQMAEIAKIRQSHDKSMTRARDCETKEGLSTH